MIIDEAASSGKESSSAAGDGPVIHVHFTWTADEMLAAQRLHGLHVLRRPFRYGIGVVLVLIFLAGCAAVYRVGLSFPAVVMMGIPLHIAFFRPYYQKWATKRQFRKRPDEATRMDWTFTSERVNVVSSDGSKSEIPWSSFVKAVISSQGVLLYPMPRVFYWLPRHAFASDETFREFVSLVRKSVTKTYEAGSQETDKR